MKSDRWSRLEELFHAASELSGPEREEYLCRECPDEEMRREIAGLLAAGARSEHSLEGVVDGAAAEIAEQLEPARAGESIGPYRIVRRIGEGGMAVVYLAEQEAPVARRVALKILKIGLDTREVLGRFDAERRLLSRLVHPAIARILDAGSTPSGRPYFVLELVEGEPITEYCDARRLSLRERIELIVQVCRAIHHAHQKGIVHRDLKPSNILVAEQDGRPAPKVIDFGIAKVIEQEAAREKLRTETRHGTLLGTWEYMSPEQAAGSEDLDIRTDIYSLGVILYELLAGEPPFDRGALRRAGLGELARVLSRTDPPRPSTRTATAHGAEVAARRGLEPPALRRHLRGDLDRIALRCLESDRERRYSSIIDVAEDLERHLRHEPVAARPQTVRYRVVKFVRRNRPLVVSSVAIAAVLIAATFVSLREARRARINEHLAEERQEAAVHETYRSNLSAAMLAAQLGMVGTARDLLRGIPEELRGFEWRHVSSAIDGSIARIAGEQPFIAQVLGEDGETLTTVTAEGRVERWSATTGALIDELALGAAITGPASFDRGATLLAAVHGKDCRTIALWDLCTGEKRTEIIAEIPRVHVLVLHPDGESLAYGGQSARLVRFDGSPAAKVHGARSTAFDYSADGLRLAHGFNPPIETHGPGWVVDVDARTALGARHSTRPGAVEVNAVALDREGKRLALAMEDKSVWIQECESREYQRRLGGHLSKVLAVDWSPTGDRLATGSADATVRVWDPDSGATLAVLLGPSKPILSVAFSGDGTRIYARSEGAVWIWEHPAGHPSTLLLGHGTFVYGVAFAGSGGERLLSGGWDWTLRTWSAAAGEFLGQVRLTGVLRGLRASRDGRVVVSADNHIVRIRDGDLLSVRAELPPYDEGVLGIDLDAAGARLAVRSSDALEVWSVDPPERLLRIAGRAPVFAGVAISPDGTRVATSVLRGDEFLPVNEKGDIRLAPLDEGDFILAEVDGPGVTLVPGFDGGVTALCWSPDGERIACGAEKGAVLLRDARTGELVSRLGGHRDKVYSLAFSPDGKRLASGSNDTTIRLWDAERGSEVAILAGHEDYVYALAFAPDGSCLASGSGDGSVRVWDTRPESQRRSARADAARRRAEARPAAEARVAELGSAAAALRSFAVEPPTPARSAAIEAIIEGALRVAPQD